MADAATTLASAPIGKILLDLALAIADAQTALDDAAIETAERLATTVGLERGTGADKESFSLLELGFAPTFYNFVEADLEVVLETRIQEETTVGLSLGVEGSVTRPSMAVGMTMSADFQRKFGVETSGHTRISAKLVALPPPSRFLEVLGA